MNRAVISLVTLALAAGCGTSNTPRATASSTGASSTVAPATAPATPTTSAHSTTPNATSARAGVVDHVQPKGGTVDNSPASDGTLLRRASHLAVDPQGEIDFHLDTKLRSCRALPGSQAQITPTASVLIEFVAGIFLCATTATGPLTTFGIGAAQQFYSNDPVFVVQVNNDGSSHLEVIEGFVATNSPDGHTTIIGPGQAADLIAGQPPTINSFRYTGLPEDERAYLDTLLRTDTNTAEYPTPDTTQSPTLARVLQRRLLRIAVTGTADQNAVLDLTRRLFGSEFTNQWDKTATIETVVSDTTAETATKLLGAGQVDLVVTNTPPPGPWTPLVQDDTGQPWYITHDPTDTELARVLADSMRAVLVNTCTSGDAPVTDAAPNPSCYEQARHDLFTQPETTPLDLFAGLLGLQTR